MNRLIRRAALSLIATLAFTTVAVAADPLPAGPGRDIAVDKCSTCHATAVVANERHDTDGWSEVVDKMVDRGLVISDADHDAVVAYLTKVFPPATSGAVKPDAKR
jgi:mono/diheme cytochrome c family protein